jgi:arylsulfatase
MIYSGDETCDVGSDTGTPVSEDYGVGEASSTARSSGCSSTPGVDDLDHFISPDERLSVAMATQ